MLVLEANPTIGGGCRTAELTKPGFLHDICSSIHPLAIASPFMRSVPLAEHGARPVFPDASVAHPLDGGRAAVMERSVDATAQRFGTDGDAYRRIMAPLVDNYEHLISDLLGPLKVPRHPISLARFGLRGVFPATRLASSFQTDEARALIAGIAAHSILRLDRPPTAAFGLMLGMLGHAVGWPAIEGGSQKLADALASILTSHGGEIRVDSEVTSVSALPSARAYLFDVTPRQLLRIAGERLPGLYKRRMQRFRYGPGVFKIDHALSEPVPWANDGCKRATTVHVGGHFEQVAESELTVSRGRHPDRPFVLTVQTSLIDPSRAPAGHHTLWSYCHVPHRSTVDMTERIENQIERFAPGFRDVVLDRHVMAPVDMERHNANYIGGDINGGIQDLRQHFTRPVARVVPYSTPADDVFICSSSTPPGGGVHGMCGHHAARAALRGPLR